MKVNKKFVVSAIALIVIQLVWYVAVEYYVRANFIKIDAEIVSISERYNSNGPRSPSTYSLSPTFRYELDGRLVTDRPVSTYTYGKSGLFNLISRPAVGDKVPVYIDNSNRSSFVRFGVNANALWFLPLLLGITLFILYLIYISIRKLIHLFHR